MSRIGKQPVKAPSGVTVSIKDRVVTVEGKLGTLSMTHRPEVSVVWDEASRSVVVSIDEADMKKRPIKAYWGLTRSLIQNMVTGVSKGYEKSLEVVGVGWTAQSQGGTLSLNVGYASPVVMPIPTGLDVSVERQLVKIKGVDKQLVGEFAAEVRAKRKPEPYNGKGIKYADEVIRRKQGKQFGA